jgi:hypothetical protein
LASRLWRDDDSLKGSAMLGAGSLFQGRQHLIGWLALERRRRHRENSLKGSEMLGADSLFKLGNTSSASWLWRVDAGTEKIAWNGRCWLPFSREATPHRLVGSL